MTLKLVSVTKTSRIIVDGKMIERERVVQLSHNWTEKDIILFKKVVKQGGSVRIKGTRFDITPNEKIVSSKGWADGGAAPMHGPEKE